MRFKIKPKIDKKVFPIFLWLSQYCGIEFWLERVKSADNSDMKLGICPICNEELWFFKRNAQRELSELTIPTT